MSYFPFQPTVIFHTAVASSVTGTTSATTLASFNLKGILMGLRDTIMLEAIYSVTNSANTKNLSITVGGTAVFGLNVSTVATNGRIIYFMNRESLSAQLMNATSTNGTYGNVGNSSTTVNTGITQAVLYRGTLTNAGETITLERATATIVRTV